MALALVPFVLGHILAWTGWTWWTGRRWERPPGGFVVGALLLGPMAAVLAAVSFRRSDRSARPAHDGPGAATFLFIGVAIVTLMVPLPWAHASADVPLGGALNGRLVEIPWLLTLVLACVISVVVGGVLLRQRRDSAAPAAIVGAGILLSVVAAIGLGTWLLSWTVQSTSGEVAVDSLPGASVGPTIWWGVALAGSAVASLGAALLAFGPAGPAPATEWYLPPTPDVPPVPEDPWSLL